MFVSVFFAEGFEEIEAITIVDVLRRAGVETKMVSITDSKTVMGSHNIPITTDILFSELNESEIEMVVLPGGLPGSTNLQKHEGLQKLIASFHNQKRALAAICAAPMVFGEAGILNGESAVCYPGFEKHLKGAKSSDDSVIKSNHFITSKGPGTAFYFAFKIVEQLKGAEVANNLKNGMLVK